MEPSVPYHLSATKILLDCPALSCHTSYSQPEQQAGLGDVNHVANHSYVAEVLTLRM